MWLGVEVLAQVRVKLLVVVGGWVTKNEINAIFNSVEVKVEVGVKLGNFMSEKTYCYLAQHKVLQLFKGFSQFLFIDF